MRTLCFHVCRMTRQFRRSAVVTSRPTPRSGGFSERPANTVEDERVVGDEVA